MKLHPHNTNFGNKIKSCNVTKVILNSDKHLPSPELRLLLRDEFN